MHHIGSMDILPSPFLSFFLRFFLLLYLHLLAVLRNNDNVAQDIWICTRKVRWDGGDSDRWTGIPSWLQQGKLCMLPLDERVMEDAKSDTGYG